MSIFYKKRKYLIVAILLLSFFVFIPSSYALDPVTSVVGNLAKDALDLTIGNLAKLASAVLGWISGKIVAMIIGFANYSNFVNNDQVKEGWTVVRDLCNMFFILILLFIAFAVILRLESYSIKKSLPKLLMMAVLINFSRTICGILIDLSQIIMLTFIGPITEGQGNFHAVLQMDNFLSAVSSQNYSSMNLSETTVYYIIAVLFMLISCVVLIAILISLVMRIVMFWIYIVLSPLAFLLSSFPGGQRYAGQYWGEFTKYLINGPVLAFFLWLSLYIMGNLNTDQLGSAFPDGPVKILMGPNLARFVMAIGMLVGGLTISAQIGGIGSKWGSDMVSNIKNKGIGVAKRVSGYDAVADRAKAYMAMRKSARDEKIRESTSNIAGVIGKTKKSVASIINEPAKQVWGAIGGNRARELEKQINSDSKQLANYKDLKYVKNMENARIGSTEYSKLKNGKWINESTKQEIKAEDLQKELVDNKQSEIDLKTTEKKRLFDRQATVDKWAKRGLGAVGAIGGGILGGVPGMLYGTAAGRYGVTSIANDIKEAGKTDLDFFASYQSKKVSSEGEDMKNADDDKVKSTVEDPTMPIFKRMAASLELIARKKTDVKGIENMRRDIASKFEDKTKAVFENTVTKNYPGATKMFNFDKDNPDADTNKRKVREAFERGSFSLGDLDSDTLLKCGQQIAEGLKYPTFKRQYDALSDSKKDVIIKSLKDADNKDAREKIAKVKNIDEAYAKGSPEVVEFTQKLNIKNIQEILNEGDQKQRSALSRNIMKDGDLMQDRLSKGVYDRLMDQSIPASKAIVSALKAAANEAQQADNENV